MTMKKKSTKKVFTPPDMWALVSARAAYRKAIIEAEKELRKAQDLAEAAFGKIAAPARKKYNAVTRPARSKADKARKRAYAKYLRIEREAKKKMDAIFDSHKGRVPVESIDVAHAMEYLAARAEFKKGKK
jgi:hypothetical protein